MRAWTATFVAALFVLPVAAMAQGQAGSAHPSRQAAANGGLFPPNQPVPEYATGANNPDASLANPNLGEPNAGNTGLQGSSGNSYGWWGHAPKP